MKTHVFHSLQNIKDESKWLQNDTDLCGKITILTGDYGPIQALSRCTEPMWLDMPKFSMIKTEIIVFRVQKEHLKVSDQVQFQILDIIKSIQESWCSHVLFYGYVKTMTKSAYYLKNISIIKWFMSQQDRENKV